MTIEELHKILSDEIVKGNKDTKIYFDTETALFDCHLVEIKEAFHENVDNEDYLILYCDGIDYIHISDEIYEIIKNNSNKKLKGG